MSGHVAGFDQLASKYFESSYRASPTSATDLGIHDYDHLLDDLSQSAIRARINELRSFRRKFRALEARGLQNSLATDLALIQNDIEMELVVFPGHQGLGNRPFLLCCRPVLFHLFSRIADFAPGQERVENLAAAWSRCLICSPRRVNLKKPPHILTEIGIEETEGAIEFCETLIARYHAGYSGHAETGTRRQARGSRRCAGFWPTCKTI